MTNPRWRTVAILKNCKRPYLHNGSTDLHKIRHGDAFWTSKGYGQLKFPTLVVNRPVVTILFLENANVDRMMYYICILSRPRAFRWYIPRTYAFSRSWPSHYCRAFLRDRSPAPLRSPLSRGECRPPSNTWLLGPTLVFIPNGISIGSAILRSSLQSVPILYDGPPLPPPQKLPLFRGICTMNSYMLYRMVLFPLTLSDH